MLVNITATRGLKMKEVNEVMNTVREFAADDAHIIFGAVFDEAMGEGNPRHRRRHRPWPGAGQAPDLRSVINTPVLQATGTRCRSGDGVATVTTMRWIRRRSSASARVRRFEALANSGVDRYDIPAFLRKQAD